MKIKVFRHPLGGYGLSFFSDDETFAVQVEDLLYARTLEELRNNVDRVASIMRCNIDAFEEDNAGAPVSEQEEAVT